ncbi:Pfs NACHT and ankyrin domain protein [Penicillium verhagenii]|nr:Pfs NACHT and ankyrin domain protein [Penicillium verhagenii]
MAAASACKNSDLYTVGWIAALSIECAAATAMLDERHDTPHDFSQSQSDENLYTWGKIGEHHVVIVSLLPGAYGTPAAANMASNLLASLPDIRFALVVGIASGIPRPDQGRDIRLGDVIIGQPQGTTGGVIQYDLTQVIPQDQKVFLSKPPPILLQAMGSVQVAHELEESKVPEFLNAMPRKRARASTGSKGGQWHNGGRDCLKCDVKEQVERGTRFSTYPEVHYGIIASGNAPVKDSAARESIVENAGDECICFQWEAAGLMNYFPCLVVRGICDYADSHKNDQWHRYASATAAAYGKELLHYITSRGLKESQLALDVLKSVKPDIKGVNASSNIIREKAEFISNNYLGRLSELKDWLPDVGPETELAETLEKRQDGTGSWLLESGPFKEWKSGKRRSFWLHGPPGCGKTVLGAMIVDHLDQTSLHSPIILSYFFSFRSLSTQSIIGFVGCLILQLYSKCPDSRADLDAVFSSHEDGSCKPTTRSLFKVFSKMLSHAKQVHTVIDALDECKLTKYLLLWIQSLMLEHPRLRLLVISRKEEEIESGLQHFETIFPILPELVDVDIRAYVYQRLRGVNGFERWSSHSDLIVSRLMQNAHGVFRWVECQLDALQSCIDVDFLEKWLQDLPATLEETYGRILANVTERHRPYVVRILQFLTYSTRPLVLDEAAEIMAIDPSQMPLFNPKGETLGLLEIVKSCSSLVTMVKRGRGKGGGEVQLELAHFSVQEYLKSSLIQISFPKDDSETGATFQNAMKETTARGLITRTCLAYMSYPNPQKTRDRIRAEFPLTTYSTAFWRMHAEFSETEEEVQQSIIQFFGGTGCTLWLKFYPKSEIFSTIPSHDGVEISLWFASNMNLPYTTKRLLYKESLRNRPDDLTLALHCATEKGHIETVRVLLEAGASAKLGTIHDYSPLQFASWRGHTKVVNLLLKAGARINYQTSEGTALFLASRSGHFKTVNLLLKAGAKFFLEEPFGENAIEAALDKGHTEIANVLLEADAKANPSRTHEASLYSASSIGHVNIVRLFLTVVTDVNTEGLCRPALVAASDKGHTEVVKVLLAAGADVHAYGGEDFVDALHAATWNGHVEIVQLLLEAGADPEALASKEQRWAGHGDCALEAAQAKNYGEIIQLFDKAIRDGTPSRRI